MGSNADEGIAQLCTSLLILNVSEVVLTINFRVNFRLCRLFDNSTTMMLYSDRVSSFSQDFKIFFFTCVALIISALCTYLVWLLFLSS